MLRHASIACLCARACVCVQLQRCRVTKSLNISIEVDQPLLVRIYMLVTLVGGERGFDILMQIGFSQLAKGDRAKAKHRTTCNGKKL